MARPANADAQATRQRVLHAASRLFSERGFAATSVRSVASEAQVNVATIHLYFQSKEGLYERCVDRMYAELATLREELVPKIGEAQGDPGRLVEHAVVVGYRFARSNQASLRLLMRTIINRGELDVDRRERDQMPHLERATELLALAMGQPEAPYRLAIQSVVHLVVRYALSTRRELVAIAGLPIDTPDPHPHIERHLTHVALQLLALKEKRP